MVMHVEEYGSCGATIAGPQLLTNSRQWGKRAVPECYTCDGLVVIVMHLMYTSNNGLVIVVTFKIRNCWQHRSA